MRQRDDIFLQPTTRGFIYGLFASDEPLQIRYVGMTINDPAYRLASHFSKSGRKGIAGQWFARAESRGAKVGMRVLGEYPINALASAERVDSVLASIL